MHAAPSIRFLSLLLTFVAGFCDTVTFIAADELFSAHVTGNFIVLAYDLVNQSDAQAWMKLLTFPVFTLAVMLGRWLDRQLAAPYGLVRAEGLLLVAGGVLAFFTDNTGLLHLVTMLIVVAMGFQNTFGKLYSQQTYGPTTVMTGNVTQASLDVIDSLTMPEKTAKRESLKKQLVIIAGFLSGCLLGAVSAKLIGLSMVTLPGLVLLFLFSGTTAPTQNR